MFEWYPRLDLLRARRSCTEQQLEGGIRLISVTKPTTLDRRKWRTAFNYSFAAIALGTEVLWDHRHLHLCITANVPRQWLSPTAVPHLEGSSLDEVLCRAFLNRPYEPLPALTTGGLPWEIALISDLDAQRVAAEAWMKNRV